VSESRSNPAVVVFLSRRRNCAGLTRGGRSGAESGPTNLLRTTANDGKSGRSHVMMRPWGETNADQRKRPIKVGRTSFDYTHEGGKKSSRNGKAVADAMGGVKKRVPLNPPVVPGTEGFCQAWGGVYRVGS